MRIEDLKKEIDKSKQNEIKKEGEYRKTIEECEWSYNRLTEEVKNLN